MAACRNLVLGYPGCQRKLGPYVVNAWFKAADVVVTGVISPSCEPVNGKVRRGRSVLCDFVSRAGRCRSNFAYDTDANPR